MSVPEPAPVLAEQIPHASAPVALSELAQASAGRAWEIAGAAAGALAIIALLIALVVVR